MRTRRITTQATLGDVIDAVYEQVMNEFGDPELARLSAQALAMECLVSDDEPLAASAPIELAA